ncbi:MAG: WXG100 family type VII secretion target [Oscillibacter sp.]|nr:WXG100 family type VII secretion target [Oscillibacter sp.]
MAITVKVSTAQLDAAASKFDTSRDKCVNLARQMMDAASRLRGSWKGEAANNYYNKLTQIHGDLEDMKRIIDEQAKDLRAMSKVYAKAENDVAVKSAGLDTDVLNF